jgi:hypothetical protein
VYLCRLQACSLLRARRTGSSREETVDIIVGERMHVLLLFLSHHLRRLSPFGVLPQPTLLLLVLLVLRLAPTHRRLLLPLVVV